MIIITGIIHNRDDEWYITYFNKLTDQHNSAKSNKLDCAKLITAAPHQYSNDANFERWRLDPDHEFSIQ